MNKAYCFFLLVNFFLPNLKFTLNQNKIDSQFLPSNTSKGMTAYADISLFYQKKDSRIIDMQTDYAAGSEVLKKDALPHANRPDSFETNAYIVALIVICVIGSLAIAWLNYCIKKSNRTQKKENQLTRKKLLFCETELMRFTHKVVEKSHLIEALNVELEKIRAKVGCNYPEYTSPLDKMMHSTILTDKEWKEFKGLFEMVYPGFFCNLRAKYSDLSTSEIRLAGLIKLNLTSKEVSNMLGISHESVNKSRYRLRKKINLSKEEDLKEHFEGL